MQGQLKLISNNFPVLEMLPMEQVSKWRDDAEACKSSMLASRVRFVPKALCGFLTNIRKDPTDKKKNIAKSSLSMFFARERGLRIDRPEFCLAVENFGLVQSDAHRCVLEVAPKGTIAQLRAELKFWKDQAQVERV